MQITERMDLKAPGYPLVPPLPSWTTGGPFQVRSTAAQIRDYLREAAGPVLGLSRRPPRAHARVRAQDGRPEVGAFGSGCQADFPLGRGLRRASALGPHHCSFPPGDGRLQGGPTASEEALTCRTAAGARAKPAPPPLLQLSPRQPAPPVRRHVGAVQPITGRSRRGASWEERRAIRELGL